MNAQQRENINKNILSAMSAARNIAKGVESPHYLDDGSLEMLLFLSQKAISDLRVLQQKQLYSSSSLEDVTVESKLKQVRGLASNAYDLMDTLDQLQMSPAEKKAHANKMAQKLRDIYNNFLKDLEMSESRRGGSKYYG